jgi:hypothetical protein
MTPTVPQLVIKNEGTGKIINKLFVDYYKIKTQVQKDKWIKSVQTIKLGTYGTIDLIDTIKNLEPKFPNDSYKDDFYSSIKKALKNN